MDDDFHSFQKLKDFLSSETTLLRTILVSSLTVILICCLLYCNYVLVGEFFSSIFLAFVTSMALENMKADYVDKIQFALTNRRFFVKKSYLVGWLLYSWRLVRKIWAYALEKIFKQKTLALMRKVSLFEKPEEIENSDDSFTQQKKSKYIDNYTKVLCSTLVYVSLFKLDWHISLLLVGMLLVLDFLFKLGLDAAVYTLEVCKLKDLLIKDEKPTQLVHSLVAAALILGFTFLLVILLCLLSLLVWHDTKSVLVELSASEIVSLSEGIPDPLKDLLDKTIFIKLKTVENMLKNMGKGVNKTEMLNKTFSGVFLRRNSN